MLLVELHERCGLYEDSLTKYVILKNVIIKVLVDGPCCEKKKLILLYENNKGA